MASSSKQDLLNFKVSTFRTSELYSLSSRVTIGRITAFQIIHSQPYLLFYSFQKEFQSQNTKTDFQAAPSGKYFTHNHKGAIISCK